MMNQEQCTAAILEQGTRQSTLEVGRTLRVPVSSDLRRKVQALLSRGDRRILLDLARLSEIDAAGVGELVRAFNSARAARASLQIARPSRRVRRVLQTAGLLHLLTAEPTITRRR
jgi:anti-anti-sigma factor